MNLVPKIDNPLYSHDRCQCTECGYIFLRSTSLPIRLLGSLCGDKCPNCYSRKTIRLDDQNAKLQPGYVISRK
ncbi:MAG: hypothetical protein IJS50_00900 [Desulfovibrio sp.]|nr:hypothetical protein [Desulfovibrio sp.]